MDVWYDAESHALHSNPERWNEYNERVYNCFMNLYRGRLMFIGKDFRRYLLVAFMFIGLFYLDKSKIYAQESPTANFETDKLVGISPFAVQFTDMSTNNPTSWVWDFGDGNKSTEQNPPHTYILTDNTETDFTVTLTVSNSTGKDTIIRDDLITVFPGVDECEAVCVADPVSGCAPLEIQFTDKSTGNPISWAWDFGDGNSSSEQNPDHTYNAPGNYTVTLTVTTDCGQAAKILDTAINVIECGPLPPVSNFTADPQAGRAPLEVQFSNTSGGGKATSFAWKFGDGTNSSEESPKHTYINPGNYTPSLFVSNAEGKDIETKTELINVLGGDLPRAEFEATPQAGFGPLAVLFSDKSTGNVENWSWDFGDGVISKLRNPLRTYINPGFYNVELTVSGSDGIGSIKKIELINVLETGGPTAAFTGAPLLGNAPFTVHFFDHSGGDVSNRIWEFGDGNVSTEQNPIHTYNSDGTFDVTLTVEGGNNSSVESKAGYIVVVEGENPTADFNIEDIESIENDDKDGCSEDNENKDSVTVKFVDISSSTDNDVDLREWDFGDGSKSNDKEPEHTFCGELDEAFTVSLTIQDSKGFDSITKPAVVSITQEIVPGFIKGQVSDKSTGEILNDVIVKLTDSTKTIARVDTTSDGLYFIVIAQGIYSISAKKEGFREFIKSVILTKPEIETLNIELENDPTFVEKGTLVVDKDKASSSFRNQTAQVTAFDENESPLQGVLIKAFANSGAKVNPQSKKTDQSGNASFKFKFGFASQNGKITFTADGFSEAVIVQE